MNRNKVAPQKDNFSWANNLTFYDSSNNIVTTSNFLVPPSLTLYDENGNQIKSTDAEYPEQCLSHTFVDPSACVLELGARYGSVSCIINKKLQVKSNQISVEPDSNVWNALERNILLNECFVTLHKGFVSRKPLELLNYGYASVSTPVETSSKESLSVEQLESKYNITFDTLVADCEGFLETFFDENPTLYSQLHTVIFEADYPNKCNYEKIRSTLKNNGFKELVHGFQNVYKKDSDVHLINNIKIESLDENSIKMINHTETSFNNAILNKSKVTPDILALEGMTGIKTRHFYNNLLSVPDMTYLEIGTWKGSSVCSAMCNNKATVVCIDNWSLYGLAEENKHDFNINFAKFKGENNATFIESDCFKVDLSKLPMFNIYLFDGEHTFETQYNSLTYYINNLENTFIFIVDDWNWDTVRNGTKHAISKLNLKVLYEREVRTTLDNSHPYQESLKVPHVSWHNGIYIAVIQKA